MVAPQTPTPNPPNYFRIAWQSALAAGLCLGLPAGLSLWLVLFQQINHSALIASLAHFLQTHGLYRIYILVFSSILWSYLLGRISRYSQWWLIAFASAFGIFAAWFSPLANIDGILYDYRPNLPIHLNYAAAMVGIIGSVTLFVGLAYGLVLRNSRAAFTMGLTTSLVSKVTVTSLLTSALTGGMVLGLGFSWIAGEEKDRPSVFP
jgi:hypothetical protein